MKTLEVIAELVDQAAVRCAPIDQLSARGHELTLQQAYDVQSLSIERRRQRGERPIGVKMGFTSRAKMAQMGISDLIWGQLTDAMLLDEGGTVAISRFIHPRVEPEIAFLLKHPLVGKVSLLQAQAAIEAVAPALEIIDSRYRNFKFSLTDVVADNSSSSAVVIGAWRKPPDDISNLGMVMSMNGREVQIGSSAAILGHPLRSLVAAARLVQAQGLTLEPGCIVMAGGATAAESLTAGTHVTLDVEVLGRAEITVVSGASS